MTTALIVLAPGAEEIEAVTIPDVLVRAGIEVTVASAGDTTLVRGSRGITLGAHALLDLVRGHPIDLISLPGGLGSATACRDDPRHESPHQTRLRRNDHLTSSPGLRVPQVNCRARPT